MRIGPFDISEPAPELHEPHALAMLRPWVDVGSVGSLALTKLERHYGARELGKLARPGQFFDFTRYRPNIVVREGRREITVPNSFISYAQQAAGPDLLFLHLLEPHMYGEDYCEGILDILKTFGVRRYALIGSMYDAVPHTRPLTVTGSIQGPGMQQDADRARVEASTYQGPTTITYLVTQQAPELGVELASMIVHLPQYVQLDEDYTGVARVLEVLRTMYNFPDHLIDHKRGEAQYEEITKAVASNPRLLPVIKQLEATYDAKAASQPQQPQQPDTPLSPEVERFLKEIDERFEDGGQK